jgi:hypothetical protein
MGRHIFCYQTRLAGYVTSSPSFRREFPASTVTGGTSTGMHGVTHDPTLFHSVCWLAECIAANHQIDFALISSLSEGYFLLNLVKI